MILTIAGFTVGLLLLLKGAEWLVEGASSLAKRLGVSDLSIGLTVVAFGTSMPELVVNVTSSLSGATDIAIGNVVGSNVFNIFWILGVSALIAPLPFSPAMNTDLIVTVAATVLLFFAVHTGYVHRRLFFWKQREHHIIERADGILMLALYARPQICQGSRRSMNFIQNLLY